VNSDAKAALKWGVDGEKVWNGNVVNGMRKPKEGSARDLRG
jgi:hypothetical protein